MKRCKPRHLVIFFCIILTYITIINISNSTAIPTLQLDIGGGVYDPYTETIIASDPIFTLYAILNPGQKDLQAFLAETYYISAAIVPKVKVDTDMGSFVFNGDTINITGDMVYGNPPIETIQLRDPGDLPKHGIFLTYFSEFPFMFNPSNTVGCYNTQYNPGGFISNPGDCYYTAFTVDTSLVGGTNNVIHFDLYNTVVKKGGDIDVDDFAPFSHDAQSVRVAEPSTFILLLFTLVTLAGFAMYKNLLKFTT